MKMRRYTQIDSVTNSFLYGWILLYQNSCCSSNTSSVLSELVQISPLHVAQKSVTTKGTFLYHSLATNHIYRASIFLSG